MGIHRCLPLVRDLSDGVRLIQLMLTNIGPEDIIDGNLKLILGMIWTLILRFTIADIQVCRAPSAEEGLSAKEGLLLWFGRMTGAVCADPLSPTNLLDYDKLDKLAFKVAAEHLNIPQLLEVEDLCDSSRPDERSVMTYIASFFHAFSSMDQAETVSRRVEKFAELMQSVWVSQNELRAACASGAYIILPTHPYMFTLHIPAPFRAHGNSDQLGRQRVHGTYSDAKQQSAGFNAYKHTSKRTWVVEKQDLATLFGNVQTKLRTYGLREYVPPPGLTLSEVDSAWSSLLASEARRSRTINAQIRQIKERLRKSFADLANDFEQRLRVISSALAALEGPLEVQQQSVQEIQTRIPAISDALRQVSAAEAECQAANVEENDYTVFTCQDLEFELELVVQSIAKKIAFIDNQIVSRNMSNLTPAQLEQFESTFRYFDKDETNTLNQSEMTAALASLGIVYSDEDMNFIYDQLLQDYGAITFEAFINLLVDITEDQTSPEQLREAFRGIAADKPFVTELDLRLHHLPGASIEYLSEVMPRARGGGEAQYDYERWLDDVFA
ncbi:actinin-like protein [Mycena leptocephala]|nr:actinin-like protein [Mycena leptocephala]